MHFGTDVGTSRRRGRPGIWDLSVLCWDVEEEEVGEMTSGVTESVEWVGARVGEEKGDANATGREGGRRGREGPAEGCMMVRVTDVDL